MFAIIGWSGEDDLTELAFAKSLLSERVLSHDCGCDLVRTDFPSFLVVLTLRLIIRFHEYNEIIQG